MKHIFWIGIAVGIVSGYFAFKLTVANIAATPSATPQAN